MFGSSENTPLYDDTLAVAYRMLREANFKARDTACHLLGQLKTTESEIPLIMQQLDDVAANDPTATVRAKRHHGSWASMHRAYRILASFSEPLSLRI